VVEVAVDKILLHLLVAVLVEAVMVGVKTEIQTKVLAVVAVWTLRLVTAAPAL
jgi:hypothetical protein